MIKSKNNYIYLIFSLLFINFYNYSFAQDTVYTKYFYPNGIVSSEGFLINNEPDGYWKNYYPDGILKSYGKRTGTLLDSIWNFYDEKGTLVNSVSYALGKKNGYNDIYTVIDDKELRNLILIYVKCI
ncbi:MAG: hypothetical protein IPO21_00110 [Bacteroidales bacterium]|nr:hypothetical protein [Bacteroidales bacterium]